SWQNSSRGRTPLAMNFSGVLAVYNPTFQPEMEFRMSQDNTKDASPTVALFQKAHTKMVALQRVEEQFNSLIVQRRKLQDELRAVQSEINGEFDRLIEPEGSPKVQLQISEEIAKRNAVRMPVRMEAESA